MYETGLRLVERVADLLGGARRSGLFADFDGTISAIAERPEDAQVDPRARAALDGLKDRLTLVAVVTGRNVADARRLVDLDGLIYIGNHGLEILRGDNDGVLPEARSWVARIARVIEDVQAHVDRRGVLFENKGPTASIHYRLAADHAAARTELLQALEGPASTSGLRVEEGRMVINILPPLQVTKGSAVAWLASEHQLEAVVYIGDDVTDTHAFRALAALRDQEKLSTLSIGVVGPETSPSVRETVDAAVPSVEAVADLLCGVLERL